MKMTQFCLVTLLFCCFGMTAVVLPQTSQGRIFGINGRGIANVEIAVEDGFGTYPPAKTISDANGAFTWVRPAGIPDYCALCSMKWTFKKSGYRFSYGGQLSATYSYCCLD